MYHAWRVHRRPHSSSKRLGLLWLNPRAIEGLAQCLASINGQGRAGAFPRLIENIHFPLFLVIFLLETNGRNCVRVCGASLSFHFRVESSGGNLGKWAGDWC